MKYVIECEGILYGPFETDRAAADWALKRCGVPWRLRSIHTLPPTANADDRGAE